ncbi:hypothetical protein ACFLYU_04350 [Candidatus Dependentiae bacterium]
MLSLKRGKSNIVSVSLNPQYLTCCFAQAPTNKAKHSKGFCPSKKEKRKEREEEKNRAAIKINAYQRKKLTSLEFERSILFNPTKISTVISKFIKNNNITKPIIALSVSGPNIFEKMVTLSTSSPSISDFKLDSSVTSNNMQLSHTYVCPSLSSGLHSGFDFYICGISREHLFQYTLLTKKIGAKLALITTERSSIIQLYKHLNSQNFSQSQLALDLNQNNYDFNEIISPEIIAKNFILKNNLYIDLDKEARHIATGIGLFLLGKNAWKK